MPAKHTYSGVFTALATPLKDGRADLEIVPILDLIPDTEFEANAAIGIRFFFGGVATE